MLRGTSAMRNVSSSMRVAHITDLHWLSPKNPTFLEMCSKRLIGYANLYLMGRKDDFSQDVRVSMLQHIKAQNPDIVLITGDFTSTALEDEFIEAKETIKNYLGNQPIVAIPGNHDVYSSDADGRAEKHLSEWMGTFSDALSLPCYANRFINIIGLNPCRPNWLNSRGQFPDNQLHALRNILNNNDEDSEVQPVSTVARAQIGCLKDWQSHWPRDAAGQAVPPFTIIATHYPVVDRSGERYDTVHRTHGVENNDQFLAVLAESKIKPSLITHGHDHLGMMGAVAVPVAHDNSAFMAREAVLDAERTAARQLLSSDLQSYWRDAPPLQVGSASEHTTIINVSNPGSGGQVNQAPPQSKWHKQAGYCMYTITPTVHADYSPATAENYSLDLVQYIHNGSAVEANIVPYTYVKGCKK